MPYIPPGRQRASSLPFLSAIPRWLSMDEAEEREQQQTENTRENARRFGFLRRHRSEPVNELGGSDMTSVTNDMSNVTPNIGNVTTGSGNDITQVTPNIGGVTNDNSSVTPDITEVTPNIGNVTGAGNDITNVTPNTTEVTPIDDVINHTSPPSAHTSNAANPDMRDAGGCTTSCSAAQAEVGGRADEREGSHDMKDVTGDISLVTDDIGDVTDTPSDTPSVTPWFRVDKSKSCSRSWPFAGHAAQTRIRLEQAAELVFAKASLAKDEIDTPASEQKTQNQRAPSPNPSSSTKATTTTHPDMAGGVSQTDTNSAQSGNTSSLGTQSGKSSQNVSSKNTTCNTENVTSTKSTNSTPQSIATASIDPLDCGPSLSKSPSSSSLSSLSSMGSLSSLSSLSGFNPVASLSQLRRGEGNTNTNGNANINGGSNTAVVTNTNTNTTAPTKATPTNTASASTPSTTPTTPQHTNEKALLATTDSALSDSDCERPPTSTKSASSRRAERPSLTRTTSSPGLEKKEFPAVLEPEAEPSPASPPSPPTEVLTRAGSSEDVPSTVFSCPDSLTSPERRSSILTQLQMPVSPSIIRKKSGELVKSSLKLSSLVRNKSMPESSMKSAAAQAIKNVHFDQKLEHVRHFLNSDRPQAVADGSVKPRPHHHNHNGVGTFQWRDDDSSSDEDDLRKGYDKYIARTEWSLSTPNFPAVPGPKPHSNEPDPMVYLENLFLSADKNNLVGHVAVKNIAFEKQVNVRYSLDFWQTVSQVDATYNDDARKKLKDMGYDRFTFSINMNLLPQHILTQKPMHLCVRYTANGTEYWDNNGFQNFQLDFKRVPKPQRGPGRFHNRSKTEYGVGWTPKYSKAGSPEKADKTENVKPKDQERESNESFLGDFEYTVASPKAFSAHRRSSVDDSIPLKSKTKSKFVTPQRRNTDDQRANNLFSRYDFGNSFRQKTPERVKEAPKKAVGSSVKQPSAAAAAAASSSGSCSSDESSSQDSSSSQSSSNSSPPTTAGTGVLGGADGDLKKAPSIGNLAAVMTGGVKPAVDSPSYQEMINKYCFFGSAPKTEEPEDYFVPGHAHSGSISSTSSTSSEDSILGMRQQQPTYVQSKISSFSSALSSAWPWNGAGPGSGSGGSSTATTPTGGEYADGALRSPTPTLGSSPTGSCLESSSPVGWAKGVEV